MKSDMELQLWLAEKLPEQVRWRDNYGDFTWRDSAGFVTEREWDYVVRQVELKLTEDQKEAYWLILKEDDTVWPWEISWQTRARALMIYLE